MLGVDYLITLLAKTKRGRALVKDYCSAHLLVSEPSKVS